MVADPNVSTILLNVDSPGGAVGGIPEFAAEVYAARKKKRVIALADTMAASAAYWIASAAETLIATPSADVGSIGVVYVHVDQSKANEAEGLRHTIIKAGENKFEGSSLEPLSEETKNYIQDRVNSVNKTFVDAVAKHRATTATNVNQNFGQGRTFRADDALAQGMIDRVATYNTVMSELTAAKVASQRRLAAYADRRSSLAAEFPLVFGGKTK
jgi:capsid assembly protease